MSIKRVLLACLVLVLAVGAAGCGSKKKSSSSTTTTTAASSSGSSSSSSSGSSSSSSSSSSSGSTPSFASAKNCQDMASLGSKFSAALAASSANGNYDNVAKLYNQLADAAPSAIKGDLKTLAGAFGTYLEALKKAGYKAGSTPTAAQIAAISQAAKSFSDPKLKSAMTHLESWAQTHCGLGK